LTIYTPAPADSAFQSIGSANNTVNMTPYPEEQAMVMQMSLGKVAVVV
jgi:hypothetical protein